MHIHILERDNVLADAICAVLEAEHYEVQVHTSLIDLVGGEHVRDGDVVITCDYVHDLTDLDFGSELAKLPAGVRLIFMSNSRPKPTHEVLAGVHASWSHLRKPFQPGSLLSSLATK